MRPTFRTAGITNEEQNYESTKHMDEGHESQTLPQIFPMLRSKLDYNTNKLLYESIVSLMVEEVEFLFVALFETKTFVFSSLPFRLVELNPPLGSATKS